MIGILLTTSDWKKKSAKATLKHSGQRWENWTDYVHAHENLSAPSGFECAKWGCEPQRDSGDREWMAFCEFNCLRLLTELFSEGNQSIVYVACVPALEAFVEWMVKTWISTTGETAVAPAQRCCWEARTLEKGWRKQRMIRCINYSNELLHRTGSSRAERVCVNAFATYARRMQSFPEVSRFPSPALCCSLKP